MVEAPTKPDEAARSEEAARNAVIEVLGKREETFFAFQEFVDSLLEGKADAAPERLALLHWSGLLRLQSERDLAQAKVDNPDALAPQEDSQALKDDLEATKAAHTEMESRITRTNALFEPKVPEGQASEEGSGDEPKREPNRYKETMSVLNSQWSLELNKAQAGLTRMQAPGIDQIPLALQALTIMEVAKEISSRITSQPGREALRKAAGDQKPQPDINPLQSALKRAYSAPATKALTGAGV